MTPRLRRRSGGGRCLAAALVLQIAVVSASVAQDTEDPVIIRSKPWLFNRETRYAHSLPEVDAATITVTKKTSVVKLDNQPVVIDNNQREIFNRLPGIVIAEQQNPTQLNLSYRGLGNPQESEYVLVMQDGLPLQMDWIGSTRSRRSNSRRLKPSTSTPAIRAAAAWSSKAPMMCCGFGRTVHPTGTSRCSPTPAS